MKSTVPDDDDEQASPAPRIDPEKTGLPGLPTWTTVYFFVLASFALWLALLIWLTNSFS
jgi:hypothetical protein